jgi:hypothetical protein
MLNLCLGQETEAEEQAHSTAKAPLASCQREVCSHEATVDKFPAGRLSSIGADGSFDALHALAYTHPAAIQIQRKANPRKNACWWHASQRMSYSKHRCTNFVGWDRFDRRRCGWFDSAQLLMQ